MKLHYDKAVIAFVLLGLGAVTRAGTYSIVGLQYDGTPVVTYGSLTLGSSPNYDVTYTAYDWPSIATPTTGRNDYPAVAGAWKWRVRWVAAPGDTPPNTVQVVVAHKGHEYVWAHVDNPHYAGGVLTSQVSITDEFALYSVTASTPNHYPYDYKAEGSQTDAALPSHTIGTGVFAEVSSGVWEADVEDTASCATSIILTNDPIPIMPSTVEGIVDVKVICRPVSVDGQTVASNP